MSLPMIQDINIRINVVMLSILLSINFIVFNFVIKRSSLCSFLLYLFHSRDDILSCFILAEARSAPDARGDEVNKNGAKN